MKLGDKVVVVEGKHAGESGVVVNEYEGKYIVRLEQGMIEILCYPNELGIA